MSNPPADKAPWFHPRVTARPELIVGRCAILDASRSGSTSVLHSRATVGRLLHLLGGCTELWSNLSAEAEVFAVRHTYGPGIHYMSAGREPVDYAR